MEGRRDESKQRHLIIGCLIFFNHGSTVVAIIHVDEEQHGTYTTHYH